MICCSEMGFLGRDVNDSFLWNCRFSRLTNTTQNPYALDVSIKGVVNHPLTFLLV